MRGRTRGGALLRGSVGAAAVAVLLTGCGAEAIDVPPVTTSAASSTRTATPSATTAPAVVVTPSATATPAPATPVVATAVWPDNAQVSHLFFHSLIVDPARAFASQEDGAGYLDYMVTKDEFTAVLEQVQAAGYVLVSPHDLYERAEDGALTPKPLALPVGRKPLVLSQDDVDYYEYMEGDGFADALVLDGDGVVRTRYTDAAGRTRVGADDLVPIVDDFVAAHPDFSYQGAKGVIALTGYNGVLGYRTSRITYGAAAEDVGPATAVADAMKASGWEFASHSWGHIDMRASSFERITADVGEWRDEVEPIVGPTDLFVYPFGADIAGMATYSGPVYDLLAAEGFTAFFNVDASRPAWGQWGRPTSARRGSTWTGSACAPRSRGATTPSSRSSTRPPCSTRCAPRPSRGSDVGGTPDRRGNLVQRAVSTSRGSLGRRPPERRRMEAHQHKETTVDQPRMNVESFNLDHRTVAAPYVRIADAKTLAGGDHLVKYDVRFTQPNRAHLEMPTVHSLEHLFAEKSRNHSTA